MYYYVMNIIHIKIVRYLLEAGTATMDVIKGHVPATTSSTLKEMQRLAYIQREQGLGYSLQMKGLQVAKRYVR